MTILHLDHVNIVTAELQKTRAFYCDVIGLVEGYRPGFRVTGHWLYAGDRPVVHLQAGAAGASTGAVAHFALAVADFHEMTARLDAAGVAYRLTRTPDGVFDQAFVEDPSGAVLELIARAINA